MNPDTNEFERLSEAVEAMQKELEGKDVHPGLVRSDGSPVPKTWSVFTIDEEVVLKDYTFKVAYIGKAAILLEPVGPVLVGDES